jgi:diguanylate cyclase (GGDEF)-like protein/PAS domain S-box-containing protein
MIDRTELLEAALDSRPDGIALLDGEGEIVFWNRAAEAITGYAGVDILARPIPASLGPLLSDSVLQENPSVGAVAPPAAGALVHAQHKLGHKMLAIARRVLLRNGIGEPIGMAVAFHPAQSLDALPSGEPCDDTSENECLADLEERLQNEFDDFSHGGPPFGVLWISVDQDHELRKTHGAGACRAMLEKVRGALVQGLRPTEHIGRWGDAEFLILAHERSLQMLTAHAQTMVGLARVADFRWWGDRVSVTVSIGAAQATHTGTETLTQLLERAQQAMQTSMSAGGNRATAAVSSDATTDAGEDLACSPS